MCSASSYVNCMYYHMYITIQY